MSKCSRRVFAQRPTFCRYLYFLLSGGLFRSYGAWKREGEPNPFVRPCYDEGMTSRSEIVFLFRTEFASHASR